MSEQIINVLDAICDKFGIVIDWTQENVLPYVQQLCGKYIKYEIVSSVFFACIPIILTIVFACITIFAFKYVKKHNINIAYYNEPAAWILVCGFIATIIMFVITIITVSMQIYDIIICYTFPEKIIIDYLKSIM